MKLTYGVAAVALSVLHGSTLAQAPISNFAPRVQIEDEMAQETKKYQFLTKQGDYEIIIGDHDYSAERRIGGTQYTIQCRGNALVGELIQIWRSTSKLPEYEIYFNHALRKQDKTSLDEMKVGYGAMPPLVHYTDVFEPHKLELARPILIQARKRFLPQIKKRERRLPKANCIDELLRRLK